MKTALENIYFSIGKFEKKISPLPAVFSFICSRVQLIYSRTVGQQRAILLSLLYKACCIYIQASGKIERKKGPGEIRKWHNCSSDDLIRDILFNTQRWINIFAIIIIVKKINNKKPVILYKLSYTLAI